MQLSRMQWEIASLLLAGSNRIDVERRLSLTTPQLRAELLDMRTTLSVDTDAAMMARLREITRDPSTAALEQCRARPRTWFDL